MSIFSASQLAAWTDGTWTPQAPERVTGFHFDSRQIVPGDLFVALRSERRDGHDFVAAAADQGAAAALVSRVMPHPLPQLVVHDPLTALHAIARAHRAAWPHPVVGITGSVGKTSTKDLLAHLLGRETTAATPGNFNNHLGVPLSILQAEPDVHQALVLEAGTNSPGEIAQLAELIQPQVAIVTSVGPAHLDRLHDLAGVAAEKAALLQAATAPELAIFPAELTTYQPFQHISCHAWPVYQGDGPAEAGRVVYQTTKLETGTSETDRQVSVYQPQPAPSDAAVGLTIWLPPEVVPGGEPVRATFHSCSEGMARNAALAVAAAARLGVSPKTIAKRLQSWRPLQDRGSWREQGGRSYYVDCYNANPKSFVDSLQAFHQHCSAPPRVFVLGAMFELGAERARWHRWVAERIPAHAGDRIILVGEGSDAYLPGLLAFQRSGVMVTQVATAEAASELLKASDAPVYLKGGHASRLEVLAPKAEEVSHAD